MGLSYGGNSSLTKEDFEAIHGIWATKMANDIFPHWPSWLACDYTYWRIQINWQFPALAPLINNLLD
jgi:hypothetical protein